MDNCDFLHMQKETHQQQCDYTSGNSSDAALNGFIWADSWGEFVLAEFLADSIGENIRHTAAENCCQQIEKALFQLPQGGSFRK